MRYLPRQVLLGQGLRYAPRPGSRLRTLQYKHQVFAEKTRAGIQETAKDTDWLGLRVLHPLQHELDRTMQPYCPSLRHRGQENRGLEPQHCDILLTTATSHAERMGHDS